MKLLHAPVNSAPCHPAANNNFELPGFHAQQRPFSIFVITSISCSLTFYVICEHVIVFIKKKLNSKLPVSRHYAYYRHKTRE